MIECEFGKMLVRRPNSKDNAKYMFVRVSDLCIKSDCPGKFKNSEEARNFCKFFYYFEKEKGIMR